MSLCIFVCVKYTHFYSSGLCEEYIYCGEVQYKAFKKPWFT
jgi:hypothetical protein